MNGPVDCRPREDPPIQAWRLTVDNAAAVARWCGGTVERDATTEGHTFVHYDNDRGPQIACSGDAVILRGCTGMFFDLPVWLYERDYVENDGLKR